jgi:flagellar biosynthetic protein FlhB
MADNDDDKTEDPTAKRREESREKGQLGKSQDLSAALVMAISILFLFIYGPQIVAMHISAARFLLGGFMDIEISPNNLADQTRDAMFFILEGMLPFMLVLFIAAIAANVSQIGLLLTFKTITPDFGKINPLKGIKNKFSLKTVMIGVMNMAKIILIAWVSYMVLKNHWFSIFRLAGHDSIQGVHLFADVFFQLAFYIVLAMLILALADFAYQKWQNTQSMRMSKQEVKDEMKNYDGDPKVKQKRRQIQLQMSRQRMMKDVKDADVVITNPTHLSVAVKYDEATMRAPIVVAKGADLLALKIREIAKENSIPLVENKPIARGLYKAVEVGEPIPQKLFKAVAEILAYVYNLKGRKTAGR